MNKLTKKLLPIVILLMSCQEPSSSPTIFELAEKQSSTIIDIFDGQDTINVWGKLNFIYQPKLSGQIFDSLKVYLDKKKIYALYDAYLFSGYNNSIGISFNSKEHADGWYKLKYLTYSHLVPDSTSRLYSYFIDTTSVTINIDNAPPQSIMNIESQIVNGKLQISWPKYIRGNFQHYQIVKNENKNTSYTITDNEITFWRDPDYVGGDDIFRINIKAADQVAQGFINEISYSLPIVDAERSNSDGIQISWTKCLFDSTFTKYSIMRRLGSRGDWEKIGELNSIADTSYFDPIFIFGDRINYRLDVLSPQSTTTGNSNFSYFGTAIPSFLQLKYSNSQNLIYLLNPNAMDPTTHIMNAETMNINRTINATVPIFSNDCSKAYYISLPSSLISVDPQTFAMIEEYKLPDFIERELSYIDEVKAANNGRIIFRGFTYKEPTYYFDRFYLFDLNNKNVLATMGDYKPVVDVSDDLNHFVKAEALYKYTAAYAISGTTVTLKKYQYCFYSKINGFITTDQNKIQITELANYSNYKEIDIEQPLYNLRLDETNDYLGGTLSNSSPSVYRIYDLNSGEKVLDSEVISSIFWLANGYIFSSSGYYIPIQDLK
jgi:hypothetical protein